MPSVGGERLGCGVVWRARRLSQNRGTRGDLWAGKVFEHNILPHLDKRSSQASLVPSFVSAAGAQAHAPCYAITDR
jgi:hypothetical protein